MTLCQHGFALEYSCQQCKNNRDARPHTSKVFKVDTLEEAQTDTEDFDLTQIPYSSLLRVARIFREGEGKYGRGNWLKGTGTKEYQLERANHALKHLLVYIHELQYGEYLGEKSIRESHKEDDLAKVLWFCCTQIELERLTAGERVSNG